MNLTVKLLNILQYTKTFQTYGKIHNMYRNEKTNIFFFLLLFKVILDKSNLYIERNL